MKNHKFLLGIITGFITYITIGCNETNQNIEYQKVDEIKVSSNNTEKKHSIEIDTTESDYEFLTPSPIQIASILKKVNMPYEDGLTNSVVNVDKYSTKIKQTLNFGVYSCDLAYCVTNDKYEQAADFLKANKKLSSKIGLETIFRSENLVDRFESNIGNQDSIMEILFHVQMMTDDYINDNNLRDISIIYFTGAWIEGMNIATHTILGNNDHKISILLSEQMTIARSIIKGLRNLKEQNDEIIDLTDHIEEVVDVYHNLWSVKKEGENIDYLDVELKHEEVVEISEMILELREEITI